MGFMTLLVVTIFVVLHVRLMGEVEMQGERRRGRLRRVCIYTSRQSTPHFGGHYFGPSSISTSAAVHLSLAY